MRKEWGTTAQCGKNWRERGNEGTGLVLMQRCHIHGLEGHLLGRVKPSRYKDLAEASLAEEVTDDVARLDRVDGDVDYILDASTSLLGRRAHHSVVQKSHTAPVRSVMVVSREDSTNPKVARTLPARTPPRSWRAVAIAPSS